VFLQIAETADQSQHRTSVLRCCEKWHWFLFVSILIVLLTQWLIITV